MKASPYGLALAAALVASLAVTTSTAQPVRPAPPFGPPPNREMSASPPTPPLNITVVALTSDGKCGVLVTLRNQGAALPANVDHVSYTLSREGQAASAVAHVPATQLRAPGSTATVLAPGFATGYQPAKFTAHAESNVRDHRTGAAPSSVSQSLVCGPTPPHLIPSVTFGADCSKTLTVWNTGGAVPPGTTSPGFWLQFKEDGWVYKGPSFMDGMGSGQSFSRPDTVRAYETFAAFITMAGGQSGESVTTAVPAHCRTQAPVHTLDITNVAVDGSCHITAALKNTGAPFGVGLQIPVAFRSPVGNDVLPAEAGAMGFRTGDTITVTSRLTLSQAPASVSVSATLPTGTLGPKTTTLSCSR